MESNFDNICKQLLQLYKDRLNKEHKASGKLPDTATYLYKWNGKYFEVYFNLEYYWKYLENGTNPHFPPVDKIEEWIKVKRLIPNGVNGKVPSTRQLAWAISKSIDKYGTKAYKPLAKTMKSPEFNELVEQLKGVIVEEINKQLEKEIDNELSR